MIKMRYILLLCFLLFSVGACREDRVRGRGPRRTQTKQLGAATFSRIKIDAPVDADIMVGPEPSLTFKGQGNLLRYLRSEVRDGTLRVFMEEHTDLSIERNIAAIITLPVLSSLDVSGVGNAKIAGPVRVPAFTLDISGAGTVDIQELHVQSFSADLSGAASLRLRSGDIGTGSFDISGAGNMRAFGVAQRNASLDLSGATSAEVSVSDRLSVDISGTGSLKYKGHPAITQDVSGVGSISAAN